MTAIGNVLPITMISRLVGFHDSNMGDALQQLVVGQRRPRSGEIQTWLADQLAVALKEPGEDLLGAVARGVREDVFSEFEGLVILHTLLSAGGESTPSLLGNAVRILAEHQDLQEHLRQNPVEIPTFAEEALRLEPPFRYHMRSVPDDTTLVRRHEQLPVRLCALIHAPGRCRFRRPAGVA
jgi:cytochrome P450